jgi:hypothetical protein
MFYLLKHLLLLNLLIFKLKCNNFIFNEILVFNTSYVCLLHSRFIEVHPIWILEDGPLIFEVVLSHLTLLLVEAPQALLDQLGVGIDVEGVLGDLSGDT